MTLFKNITLQHWRQIHKVDIEFHPRLTVLTGANGAGKTTILNILSQHFGWPINWASTPAPSSKGFQYFIDLLKRPFGKAGEPLPSAPIIGSIAYTNSNTATITAPQQVSQSTYQVNIGLMQPIKGLYIPAHRPHYRPTQVPLIPTTAPTRGEQVHRYQNLIRQRWTNDHIGESPLQVLKQSLMTLAVFGFGSEAVRENLEARAIFEGFQEVLRVVLPPKIGFERIEIRMPDVVLVTRSGDWPMDAASGGVAAIIDLCWQIYMSFEDQAFVVMIDEPENHLHPEIQQRLLPSLIKAFPSVQFIVATHNPLIIGSEPQSNIYALQFNADSAIDSALIERVDKSGTSNDILRKVLGLPYTMPIWAAERIEEVVREYEQRGLSDQTLHAFTDEMQRLGLAEFLPQTVAQLLRSNQRD